MTTIRQIVTDAFREAGILAIGEEPDVDQLDEATRRLNTMFRSLFGSELGEPLTTFNYGQAGLANSYAIDQDYTSDVNSIYFPSNSRLVFNTNATATIYLAPNPQDGARIAVIDNGGTFAAQPITLAGNGRQIEAAATVALNTNGLNREWFYRADLANWIRVIDIDIDLASPLPTEFDDFLVTLLAFRLNPRFGAQTSPEMTEVMKRMRRIFKARYSQSKEVSSEIGLYRLTSTRSYWQTTDNTTFNRGK